MSIFSSNNNWFKIALSVAEIKWQENNLAIVEINGKKITLANHQEKVFAVAYKCPHASAVMAEGYIDGVGNIVCPLHRFKFSLDKGRNVSGEGYYLKTFPIEHRKDGIYVCL